MADGREEDVPVATKEKESTLSKEIKDIEGIDRSNSKQDVSGTLNHTSKGTSQNSELHGEEKRPKKA